MTHGRKTEELFDEGEQSKEIVEQHFNAPSTDVRAPRGFESGHDQDDMIMPRAKLLQSMSPEVVDDNAPGVSGEIRNSITGEELPKHFTPLFHFKEYAKFNPRSKDHKDFNKLYEPGELIWKTNDHADSQVIKECRFGEDGSPPTAVTFFNFLSLFEGQSVPVIISFSKTSYKAGKKLYTLARLAETDMFGRRYKLTTKTEQNESGTYYVLQVDPAGTPEPEDYNKAEKLWDMLHHRKADIVTDIEGE